MEAYERATGNEVPGGYELYFLRAATEEAVRERLIRRDGEARGIHVSDASAESLSPPNRGTRPRENETSQATSPMLRWACPGSDAIPRERRAAKARMNGELRRPG